MLGRPVQRALAVERDLKPERNLAAGLEGVNCHAARGSHRQAPNRDLSWGARSLIDSQQGNEESSPTTARKHILPTP